MHIHYLAHRQLLIRCLCSKVHMAKSLKLQTCLLCLIRQTRNWNHIEQFG